MRSAAIGSFGVLAVAICCAAPSGTQAAWPVPIPALAKVAGKGLGGATQALPHLAEELLDATSEESRRDLHAIINRTGEENQIKVLSADGVATSSRTIGNYVFGKEIGDVTIVATMPFTADYYVDIRKIGFIYIPGRNEYRVTLPPPTVGRANAKLSEFSKSVSRTGVRLILPGEIEKNVYEQMLKEDFQGCANKEAQEKLKEATEASKRVMRDLLERILKTKDPTIKITVID
jgi:Protein of unknown function (DUF4230)